MAASLCVVVMGGSAMGAVLLDRRLGSGPVATRNAAAPKTLVVPRWTDIATPIGSLQAERTPETGPSVATVARSWEGEPISYPVVAVRRRWLELRLPGGPQGVDTAWVRSSGVSLKRTGYRLVIDLGTGRLMVFRRSALVVCAPDDVGAAATPTPVGHYFVAFLAEAPNATYGPFVVVTTAYGRGVTDWEQGGRPLITINGPLGTPLGPVGVHTTGGSVRLEPSALARLRPVQVGTPIDVVDRTDPLGPRDARSCALGSAPGHVGGGRQR